MDQSDQVRVQRVQKCSQTGQDRLRDKYDSNFDGTIDSQALNTCGSTRAQTLLSAGVIPA